MATALPFKLCTPHPLIVMPPTSKLTVPVGVPLPGEVAATVAVKVTFCPVTEGLALLVSVVEVEAKLTVWESAVEVEVVKLLSPA